MVLLVFTAKLPLTDNLLLYLGVVPLLALEVPSHFFEPFTWSSPCLHSTVMETKMWKHQ